MTERKHGIKVGSKVKVLSDEGCKYFTDFIGKIVTVSAVEFYGDYDEQDLIVCDEVEKGAGQWPSRFELISSEDVFEFKPWQRVILANGNTYIVMVNVKGEKVFKGRSLSWMPCQMSYPGDDAEDYNVMKVYDAPWQNNLLIDFKEMGDLLWERRDEQQKKLEVKVKEAEDALNKAVKDLEEYKAK